MIVIIGKLVIKLGAQKVYSISFVLSFCYHLWGTYIISKNR